MSGSVGSGHHVAKTRCHSGDADECDNIDCELMALCWSPFVRGGWRFVPKLLISTTTTKIKIFPCVFPTSLSPFTFSSYWKWFLPCIPNAVGIHKQFVHLILFHVNARLITVIKFFFAFLKVLNILFLTVNFRLINLTLIFYIICT